MVSQLIFKGQTELNFSENKLCLFSVINTIQDQVLNSQFVTKIRFPKK